MKLKTRTNQPVETGELEEVLATKADKSYVDEGFVKHTNKTGGNYLYGSENGIDKDYSVARQSFPDGSIAQRTTNGALFVGTPTNANHATTKKYVDDAVAGAGGGSQLFLHYMRGKISFTYNNQAYTDISISYYMLSNVEQPFNNLTFSYSNGQKPYMRFAQVVGNISVTDDVSIFFEVFGIAYDTLVGLNYGQTNIEGITINSSTFTADEVQPL